MLNYLSHVYHQICYEESLKSTKEYTPEMKSLVLSLKEFMHTSSNVPELRELLKVVLDMVDASKKGKNVLKLNTWILFFTSKFFDDHVYLPWLENLPLPCPAIAQIRKVYISSSNDIIIQQKFPDCSIVAFLNAFFIGKNLPLVPLELFETDSLFCCVFMINGTKRPIWVSKDLGDLSILNFCCLSSQYIKLIEKCFFSLNGFFPQLISGEEEHNLTLAANNIVQSFKGSSFSNIAGLFSLIPDSQLLTLLEIEWQELSRDWLRKKCVLGLGTGLFSDMKQTTTKKIKLQSGENWDVIPAHDYPIIDIIPGEDLRFAILDGSKTITITRLDLIFFKRINIGWIPKALDLRCHKVHSITNFKSKSVLHEIIINDSKSDIFVVLEKHMLKHVMHDHKLSLHLTKEEGFMWEREEVKSVQSNSQYTTMRIKNRKHFQVQIESFLDSKSFCENVNQEWQSYTLYCYSDGVIKSKSVDKQKYLLANGLWANNMGRLGTDEYLNNQIWSLQVKGEPGFQTVKMKLIPNIPKYVNLAIYADRELKHLETETVYNPVSTVNILLNVGHVYYVVPSCWEGSCGFEILANAGDGYEFVFQLQKGIQKQ
ncbi:hypothetical protein DAMA08_050400 [Martiniozyma asiatica (nom. inval.)]|nr:hypothetical protein DAMA08_050400 [Martiniozyma asiatica]